MGSEIFHALRKKLADAGHNTNVGDEGRVRPEPRLGPTRRSFRDAGDRGRRLSSRR